MLLRDIANYFSLSVCRNFSQSQFHFNGPSSKPVQSERADARKGHKRNNDSGSPESYIVLGWRSMKSLRIRIDVGGKTVQSIHKSAVERQQLRPFRAAGNVQITFPPFAFYCVRTLSGEYMDTVSLGPSFIKWT